MKHSALIGLGMVADTYADAFRNSQRVAMHSIFARSLHSQEKFLLAYPDVCDRIATSVDAIARDPEIDFVILATPPNARREIVETLAKAQVPILMEKPVERSLEKADDLVSLCDDLGCHLGIMLQHRARPVVGQLRERLDELGHLVAVEVNVPWWRPQSYYDEPGRGTYERDGGGVLINQAIHTLDLMLSLTAPVSEVTAMSATTSTHDMESEDFVVAGLAFSNGAVGQVFASTASFPGRGETIILHGSNGSARLEAGVVTLDWRNGSSETIGEAAASGAGADPMAFTSDWHRTVIEDFADSLDEDRAPMVTGWEALQVHALISAIDTASRTGQRITLGRN
ncbi:MAG: Gfo/Idh/MocA family oxidoreductase [Pseudomonadota bacterium]